MEKTFVVVVSIAIYIITFFFLVLEVLLLPFCCDTRVRVTQVVFILHYFED